MNTTQQRSCRQTDYSSMLGLAMEPLPKRDRGSKKPETIIQNKIISKLQMRGWLVKVTYGSMYQSGFPDLYCYHKLYGQRWVEVKNPKAYKFTPAQMEWFHKFASVGCGIWILTAEDDSELEKLFGPPNWHTFIK